MLQSMADENQEENAKFCEDIQMHLNNKFALIQGQFEQLESQLKSMPVSLPEQSPISNKNLDLKLSEHTELLGLMDEQLN